ncbi:hypothetical protein BDB00DRAFT_870733 [Zychaea mexicana]|uniref:uncharacterized protein n=1 Tax=Zychaea mexicana TaxID=64656 RepID=UPI0022FEF890|nr:uncharacterized protein BDB00DRAFT_870733 [Zychaea mexicana]KAI9495018.1 hypothetical protein BDB00DRAFT_870733 [Zychaea mexicana]
MYSSYLCSSDGSVLATNESKVSNGSTTDGHQLVSAFHDIRSTEPLTTRAFRHLYTAKLPNALSTKFGVLSASRWLQFWDATKMFHPARNIWFRAIHHTLPRVERLHAIDLTFMPVCFVYNVVKQLTPSNIILFPVLYDGKSVFKEYFGSSQDASLYEFVQKNQDYIIQKQEPCGNIGATWNQHFKKAYMHYFDGRKPPKSTKSVNWGYLLLKLLKKQTPSSHASIGSSTCHSGEITGELAAPSARIFDEPAKTAAGTAGAPFGTSAEISGESAKTTPSSSTPHIVTPEFFE